MEFSTQLIFVGSLLIMLSIIASLASSRIGSPM